MRICFVSCSEASLSSLPTRLHFPRYPDHRNQIRGSRWPLSGVCWSVSSYRPHSVHMAHYGSFNKWSEQLLPAQRWFTVAQSGLNDYRGRQPLTLWCALDNVMGAGSLLGKLHVYLHSNINIHRIKRFGNTITPSKSSIIRELQHLTVLQLKRTYGFDVCQQSELVTHS